MRLQHLQYVALYINSKKCNGCRSSFNTCVHWKSIVIEKKELNYAVYQCRKLSLAHKHIKQTYECTEQTVTLHHNKLSTDYRRRNTQLNHTYQRYYLCQRLQFFCFFLSCLFRWRAEPHHTSVPAPLQHDYHQRFWWEDHVYNLFQNLRLAFLHKVTMQHVIS